MAVHAYDCILEAGPGNFLLPFTVYQLWSDFFPTSDIETERYLPSVIYGNFACEHIDHLPVAHQLRFLVCLDIQIYICIAHLAD